MITYPVTNGNIYIDENKKEVVKCDELVTNCVIPNYIETSKKDDSPIPVEKIGKSAFAFCCLIENITLPLKLKSIKSYAFDCCNSLKKIEIPKNVKYINVSAFDCCNKLEEINVNEKNPYFSSFKGVLYNKNKTILIRCPQNKEEVIIDKNVKEISEGAFFCCENLEEIIIPKSVKIINDFAFAECKSLKKLVIPRSVKYIGSDIIGFNFKNTTVYVKNFSVGKRRAKIEKWNYEVYK
ncbi:MAG: leucine-rich repeat domain-containing protein [Lachnospirales bacterium]